MVRPTRARILSDLESDRLLHRRELDVKTKNMNDFRVMKKLLVWCDCSKDVIKILDAIKTEGMAKRMNADRVRDLNTIISKIYEIKKFHNID